MVSLLVFCRNFHVIAAYGVHTFIFFSLLRSSLLTGRYSLCYFGSVIHIILSNIITIHCVLIYFYESDEG